MQNNPAFNDYADVDDYSEETGPRPYLGPWVVACYLIDRAYGGPEEGGWYYDCGELAIGPGLPLPQFTFDFEYAKFLAQEMEDSLNVLNAGRPEVSSVLSEGRYAARICEGDKGVPQGWPSVRPHYE